jgi:putative glycerol-1-phosphate prenyltransferase
MKACHTKGAGFLLLIDPDRISIDRLPSFLTSMEKNGVDGFLVGSSMMSTVNGELVCKSIKESTNLPAILFPGSWHQVTPSADAILFLSLISGRNPDYLISEQVKGAPAVREYGIEAIPTGYMLIESGSTTSVEYVSGTRPIPRDKPEIAKVHALAAEYLGMKLIYLEAGSGAKTPVPDEMVSEVADYVTRPVIVGGGLRTPEDASAKVAAGASFVVIGSRFEMDASESLISEFAHAIHTEVSEGINL